MGMGMGMGMTPGGPGGMGPGSGRPGTSTGKKGATDEETEEEVELPFFSIPKYAFVVQFCWQEKQLTERIAEREQKLKEQREQELLENPQADANIPAPNTGA